MMKKLFSLPMIFLAVTLLTVSVSAAASASDPCPTGISGEARWTLQGDTMFISGSGMLSGVSNADCQPWESIQDQIRHVVVLDGVTLIGDVIFAHTYNLETVTIADSVTEICEGAFRNCYALKTVKLPANLETLGDFAFAYCETLESIELPDRLTALGGSAFTGCSAMTSCTLPETLYEVDQMTFDSCTTLTEVTIPAGVGFLRHASFSNCFNLKKVVFDGDQPHTNGDPFYMCPEDLVVYCYRDAAGWDDPLFYTYPVVKLERTCVPDVSASISDQNSVQMDDSTMAKDPKQPVVSSDSGEKIPGQESESTDEIPTIGALDPPALNADNDHGGVNAESHEKKPAPIRFPALIPVAMIGIIGFMLFVWQKKK